MPYEDEILARYSTPGLRRNNLDTPHGNNNPNQSSLLTGNADVSTDLYIEPVSPSIEPCAYQTPTPECLVARCERCGQDLEYSDTLGGWDRGLRHWDGTRLCGLADRSGARIKITHRQTSLDDRPPGDGGMVGPGGDGEQDRNA